MVAQVYKKWRKQKQVKVFLTIKEKVETQTDVNNATFIIKNAIPYLDIQNVGVVFHPAWTGLYALQYANSESYYPKEVEPNEKLFFHLIKVLEDI